MGRVAPGGHIVAAVQAELQLPVRAETDGSLRPRKGVRVHGEHERVRIQVIVGGPLRLNVRRRNKAAHFQQQALRDFWEVKQGVYLRGVVAVQAVFLQQLVAENAFGDGVAVVHAVNVIHQKAPVDVVGLNGIGLSFQAQNHLVEHYLVWHQVVRSRGVGVVRSTQVAADAGPAVHLESAFALGQAQRFVERVVRRFVRNTDNRGPVPFRAGKRGRTQRRGQIAPIRAVYGWQPGGRGGWGGRSGRSGILVRHRLLGQGRQHATTQQETQSSGQYETNFHEKSRGRRMLFF